MVPIDASTAARTWSATEAEYGATQERENIFVLMYVITSKYESSALSLILEANLCVAFDADGPSPPVNKINVQLHQHLIPKKFVCLLNKLRFCNELTFGHIITKCTAMFIELI